MTALPAPHERVDMERLREWIGRSEMSSDVLQPVPLAGLSATLDTLPMTPGQGVAVPPLWHWVFFLSQAPAHALGEDGHPRRGGFLPPVMLPRRMWAGSRFRFHRDLYVGQTAGRTSTIESVSGKQGKSEPLVFVTVRHAYRVQGQAEDALTEWHDIVYRGHSPVQPQQAVAIPLRPRGTPVHGPCERQPDGSLCQRWWPDPVLLFRYSALTFNGHRIHYDRSYATQEEGYPGLIVHGPLIATLLADLVRTCWPQRRMTAFDFRAMAPLFDTHPFSLHARQQDEDLISLWAENHGGERAMEAGATLAPA